ncbi:MAG: hypothetical protein SWH61_16010 [Thermodesulfobacteriota bacterium]|nr:hypothetical protein [Thermodesulfobacteriota bacterium]
MALENCNRQNNQPAAAESLDEGYVFTLPDLVSRELIAILVAVVILCIWSLGIDAPLKAIADPNWTENPAKAPWYFVGLQELLVYFDPWIAGVCVPGLIIAGLMAIPYIDPNPKGVGVYNFKDRKFAVPVFLTGYILWFALIVFGQFFRGPNWHFYWPWESWAIAKDAEQQLVNLPGPLGYLVLTGYFLVGIGLPVIWKRSFYKSLGFFRYLTTMLLFLVMYGVIIKMVLRIVFHIKYIIVTPWFSI